jgi:hypothetical protein
MSREPSLETGNVAYFASGTRASRLEMGNVGYFASRHPCEPS